MVQVGSNGSAPAWALAVLTALGGTDDGDNVTALALWAVAEGAPDWRHNWLNTTMGGFGGYSINSAGVKAYPTFAKGVAATAATLRQPIMSGITYALTSGLDLDVIYHAINSSLWCKGCQGGRYPVTIYNYLQGLGQAPPTSVVAGDIPARPSTDPPRWDWSAQVRAAAGAVNTRRQHLGAILQVIRHL